MYEYILFCGSDIKDLEVKTGTPPAQKEEAIYNDPAIIQSNNHGGPISAISVLAVSGSSTEFNLHGEPFVSNSRSYPSVLSTQHSGNQLGQWSSSPSPHNAISSYDRPTHWQGYGGAPGDIPVAHPHSSSSTTTLYPLQNQESTTMTATNLSNNFSPGHSSATSSSVYFNATPNLSSEQLSTPFTDSTSSKLPLQFHHSTLVNSNGLTMPFPLSYQSTSNIGAPTDNRIDPNVILPPAQSSPHLSVSVPLSDPLLRQQPPLLTPNQLTLSRLSEHCPENSLSLDQKHVGDMSSMCLKIPLSISSSAATEAVQPPLLPLPPPSEKLQYSSQLTEEFDFQAMNEKFKKDELWGYLGKANQRDKIDGAQENGTSSQDAWDDNNRSVSNGEPKVAYNKDDFFDTISCNSTSRGARNGQYRSFERMKLDSETFGSFRQRTQLGYENGARHACLLLILMAPEARVEPRASRPRMAEPTYTPSFTRKIRGRTFALLGKEFVGPKSVRLCQWGLLGPDQTGDNCSSFHSIRCELGFKELTSTGSILNSCNGADFAKS